MDKDEGDISSSDGEADMLSREGFYQLRSANVLEDEMEDDQHSALLLRTESDMDLTQDTDTGFMNLSNRLPAENPSQGSKRQRVDVGDTRGCSQQGSDSRLPQRSDATLSTSRSTYHLCGHDEARSLQQLEPATGLHQSDRPAREDNVEALQSGPNDAMLHLSPSSPHDIESLPSVHSSHDPVIDVDYEDTTSAPMLYDASYFLNYDSDDDTTPLACAMDALTMSGSLESLQLSDDDAANEASQSSRADKKDVPLYAGASISQWESLTSILSFVQSEHLSGNGLGRLLSLINLHLPKPNNFLHTTARLFKVLDGISDPVHLHYFCSVCYKFRKGPLDICDCETDDDSKCVLFFITFPLEQQLRKMFKRPGFLDDLKYRKDRKKTNLNNIEDIFDGAVFKEIEMRFAQNCFNITLMWNTDGMQIFESTSFSLWPFYFIINELSPAKRFLSENLLLAGLWGSVVKPHPNVYLLPIYQDVKALQHGIDVQCAGEKETQTVVVHVLCGCCDAPARASFMNMKQHSGFYSCPFCVVKGEKPGDATVFPFVEQPVLRTMPQYEEHVRYAVQNKVIVNKTPRNEERWCGIKGPTVLSDMVPNLFSCMGIDSMHCIYLGVMRQLLHLWSDKENKNAAYSILSKLKLVNERLRKLTPPHYLQRAPQSLEKLIYWKATELRSFMFNLALIVLKDILKPEHYGHLALFVNGVALLNSSSISEEDLCLASLQLNFFVSQFEVIYGLENMTHNLHMLVHLEQCVRFLGPLWSFSCFKFEDVNGRLSNLIHGTRHVGLQIYSNMSIITQLPLMVRNLKPGDVQEFCINIHRRYRLKLQDQISPGVFCVGTFKPVSCQYAWAENILRSNLVIQSTSCVQMFSRLLKRGMLYVSKSYGRGQRVSSFVQYRKNNDSVYGDIKCFMKVKCGCDVVCACTNEFVAIVKQISTSRCVIQGVDLLHILQHHCSADCNLVTDCDVVHIDDISTVMFKIREGDILYLCKPLNASELE